MQLDDEAIAFVQSGVSILVAAADGEGRPAICRAVGARVLDAEARLLLVLRAGEGAEVLAALAAGGPLAVMFSRPQTNRTLQLKGGAVRVGPLGPRDRDLPQRYLALMDAELQPLGHGGRLIETVLAANGADYRAVTFTATQLYDQTPGPRAGRAVAAEP